MDAEKKELVVKFLTNLPIEYQIESSSYITIPINYDKQSLNSLLKTLLKAQKKSTDKNFEFFVENKILESDILTLLTDNNLFKKYSETSMDIFYFFELNQPEMINTIKENEWIKRICMRNRELLGKYCVGLFNSEVSFYNEKFEKILEVKNPVKDEEERIDFLNDLLFFKVEKTNILITSSRFDSEKLKIYTVDFKEKKVDSVLKEFKMSDEHITSLALNILSPQFFAGGDSQGNLLIYKIEDHYLDHEKSNDTKRKKKDFNIISPLSKLEKCHDEIKNIKWMNTNQIATSGNDFNIKVFNINTNAQYCVLNSLYSVPTIINSNNELVFSGHEDGKIRIWDLRTPIKPSLVFSSHDNYVSDIKLSPVSTQLFTTIGYDGAIKLFDLRASKPLWKIQTENEKNFALEFNSAKYLLSGGDSSNINIYEISI